MAVSFCYYLNIRIFLFRLSKDKQSHKEKKKLRKNFGRTTYSMFLSLFRVCVCVFVHPLRDGTQVKWRGSLSKRNGLLERHTNTHTHTRKAERRQKEKKKKKKPLRMTDDSNATAATAAALLLRCVITRERVKKKNRR